LLEALDQARTRNADLVQAGASAGINHNPIRNGWPRDDVAIQIHGHIAHLDVYPTVRARQEVCGDDIVTWR